MRATNDHARIALLLFLTVCLTSHVQAQEAAVEKETLVVATEEPVRLPVKPVQTNAVKAEPLPVRFESLPPATVIEKSQPAAVIEKSQPAAPATTQVKVKPEAAVPVTAKPEQIDMPSDNRQGGMFFEKHIQDRLEAGTRFTYFMLLEDSGDFVGTVNKLKDEQDFLPIKIFAQYRITPAMGVGLSYDKIAAEARDDGGADGVVTLDGPVLYFYGRHANSTKYTPFVELGAAFYSATNDEDPGWDSRNAKSFELEDPLGLYIALGCDMAIVDNWSVDFYGRYMNVDVDGKYMLYGSKQGDILFTMSNLTLGIGAKYSF